MCFSPCRPAHKYCSCRQCFMQSIHKHTRARTRTHARTSLLLFFRKSTWETMQYEITWHFIWTPRQGIQSEIHKAYFPAAYTSILFVYLLWLPALLGFVLNFDVCWPIVVMISYDINLSNWRPHETVRPEPRVHGIACMCAYTCVCASHFLNLGGER